MYTPSLQIVPQRHTYDCAVACLAMLCGISYEEVLQAFHHNVCKQGTSIHQIRRAARRLGKYLTFSTNVQDLTDVTGVLCVDAPRWPCTHLVVVRDEQVIDTDATLWDLDVFLATYSAIPVWVAKLKDKGTT